MKPAWPVSVFLGALVYFFFIMVDPVGRKVPPINFFSDMSCGNCLVADWQWGIRF